jgi:hypothetical protein
MIATASTATRISIALLCATRREYSRKRNGRVRGAGRANGARATFRLRT